MVSMYCTMDILIWVGVGVLYRCYCQGEGLYRGMSHRGGGWSYGWYFHMKGGVLKEYVHVLGTQVVII